MPDDDPTPQPRPIVPEDIGAIAWIGEVDVTRDGRRVAFTVTRPSLERDENLSTIWSADTGVPGSGRPFTSGLRRDSAPKWSPDGSLLAFLSERPSPDLEGAGADKAQVYVMAAGGGEARRVTGERGGVTQFAWSPDGERLAYVAKVADAGDRDAGAGAKVPGDRAPSKPFRVVENLKYRRNGEGFVDARRHLFVVAAVPGAVATRLTEGDFDHADPAWSPDGREIAFVSSRHDGRDRDNAAAVMAVDAGITDPGGNHMPAPRTIASAGGPASWPAWSPSGDRVAFVGHAYPRDAGRHARLWVAPAAGGRPTCLTAGLDRNVAASAGARPSWSMDGRWVRTTVEDDGATALVQVEVPADGAVPAVKVVAGGRRDVSAFSWGDGAGLAVVVSSDPAHPTEVVVVHAGEGGREEALTNLNGSWSASVDAPSTRRIEVPRGDATITAWVQLPPGAAESDPSSIPVLLNIHGGPHAQYGYRFFDEFAVYSGAGFAVVYTNPRGSTGGTEDFARAVRLDWGGIDASDVLAAFDAAVHAFPCLDPKRAGVMGGSYGGYLTSWIVSHDHRFVAACSERAVNDFASFSGTSDIGFWFAEAELGASPWDDPDLAARRSPLTYAHDIRTPLLILHAEQDYRCPIEQAERLFVALAQRGHPVRFVRVPDADHELSRSGRPRQRVERFRHLLDWFSPRLGAARPSVSSDG